MTAATNEGMKEAIQQLKPTHLYPPNVPNFIPTHDPIQDFTNSKDYMENFIFQCECYEIKDLAKAFQMVIGVKVRKALKHAPKPDNGTPWEKLKSQFENLYQFDDMETFFRQDFQNTVQKEGEPDCAYLLRLEEKVLDAKYSESADPAEVTKTNQKALMVQVATGTNNKELRNKAYRKDMTWDKLKQEAQNFDTTKAQILATRSASSSHVRKIHSRHQHHSGYSKPRTPAEQGDCFFCGNGTHDRKKCPAMGVKCAACGKDNHLKPQCRNTRRQNGKVSKPYRGKPNYAKNVHRIQETYPSDSSDNETTEQHSNPPEDDNYYYSSDSSYNTDEMATCFVRQVRKQAY